MQVGVYCTLAGEPIACMSIEHVHTHCLWAYVGTILVHFLKARIPCLLSVGGGWDSGVCNVCFVPTRAALWETVPALQEGNDVIDNLQAVLLFVTGN